MEKYCSKPRVPPLTDITSAMVEDGTRPEKRKRSLALQEKAKESRKRVSNFYSALQSVVPNLHSKRTREDVVSGTIEYIKSLEREKQRLENLKESRPGVNNSSSNVEVTVSGQGLVFFGVRKSLRCHLATDVFRVFERHEAEVLTANVTVDESDNGGKVLVVAVTAVVGSCEMVEVIRGDLIEL